MKINKLSTIIVLSFTLFLTLFFPILFACLHFWEFVGGGTLAIYIVSKVFASLALIFVFALIFLRKLNMYFSYLNLWITIVLQLLPVFIRLIGLFDHIEAMLPYGWIISLFVCVVSMFVYVILFLMYKHQGDRYTQTLNNVRSKEIEVQDSDSYFDEHGNLKGIKK